MPGSLVRKIEPRLDQLMLAIEIELTSLVGERGLRRGHGKRRGATRERVA